MGKVTIDEETLDGIGQAIIAKGGATAPMTPAQMPAAIASIPSGGGGSSGFNDVNFYMPDGTIAKSYTAAEFAGLTALPDQPSLDGLTAQGWNWTLADAKTYVASYGKLNIGGMYVTDNGETRLYLTIAEPYRLEQPLRFGRSGGTGITVDWGDGSTPVTYTHTSQTIVKHTYPGSGDYVIRISSVGSAKLLVGTASYNIFGNTSQSSSNPACVYSSRLRKVEIGLSVTSIGNSAFSNCYSLSSVVIPSSVTSLERDAFSDCYSLSSVVIPSSVTSIGVSAFISCYLISSVAIPPSVTNLGPSAFYECYSLSSVTIPSSVTSSWDSAFSDCYSLSSVVMPSSVTSLGDFALRRCYSLPSVTIPSSVTSIGYSAFNNCHSLSSVTIPSSVTSIGDYSFNNCYGIVKYDFTEHTQVPTLSNKNAFNNIATDCKIVIPDSLYDTWIAATNWSDASIVGHIIKASEYVEA